MKHIDTERHLIKEIRELVGEDYPWPPEVTLYDAAYVALETLKGCISALKDWQETFKDIKWLSKKMKMKCEYPECENGEATELIFNRGLGRVIRCCDAHYQKTSDYDNQHPEYEECCQNCGCCIPVN